MEPINLQKHWDNLPKPSFMQGPTADANVTSTHTSEMTSEAISDTNINSTPEITTGATNSQPINPASQALDPNSQPVASMQDIDEVWKILYEKLKIHISKRDLSVWYKDVYLEKIENGVAQMSCNNPITREWIESNHRAFLRNKIEEIIGYKPDLIINIRSSFNANSTTSNEASGRSVSREALPTTNINPRNKTASQQDQQQMQLGYEYYDPSQTAAQTAHQDIFTQPRTSPAASQSSYQANLNPRYILNTFIVGSNNQLAYAVAEGVINTPGTAYNPVFFYGPSGVGKTHLMQAIGNAMRTQNPAARIIYVPIETFMNELIEGIRTGKNEEFRQKYRAADLLIIDDIQFVSTYKKTQEELFNTFNALYQSNKQIVIASDRPPKEIENLPDRLRTRFEGGMVVDIQAPDLETRIAILRQRVKDFNATIDDEILNFIARNIENSVRELEGAVTKVITHQKFASTPLTEADVAKMLQVDLDTKRRRIKPEKITDAVCEVFDITKRELRGSSRTAYIALARQVAMYLLREELELPLERVASEVNRKDHTTVIHACTKIGELVGVDEKVKGKIEKCKALYQI
ncbi:MAG: chromosomal replication initiator protein DnaA [Candidatus Dojkabacteria bacterium]